MKISICHYNRYCILLIFDLFLSSSRFVGVMSREESEALLGAGNIGAFVIRDSFSRPGEMSLSVKTPDAIAHVRVRVNEVWDP